MRQIEREMLHAITFGKEWSKANTRVDAMGRVYLHDNHIATVDWYGNTITVNLDTLRDWPTPTTKSRLNALGASVYTRDYETYVSGHAINRDPMIKLDSITIARGD